MRLGYNWRWYILNGDWKLDSRISKSGGQRSKYTQNETSSRIRYNRSMSAMFCVPWSGCHGLRARLLQIMLKAIADQNHSRGSTLRFHALSICHLHKKKDSWCNMRGIARARVAADLPKGAGLSYRVLLHMPEQGLLAESHYCPQHQIHCMSRMWFSPMKRVTIGGPRREKLRRCAYHTRYIEQDGHR